MPCFIQFQGIHLHQLIGTMTSNACNQFSLPPFSRRDFLRQSSCGFGALALSALLADPTFARPGGPLTPKPTHFKPKAKSVIFFYMDGGVSQVDSFDPKPRLDKEHGQKFKAKIEPTQFNNIGKTLKSPWGFKRYGKSDIPVSDLFPHVGQMVDDLCIVRSMVSKFSEHQTANYFLHTCFGQQGRPSMGAWLGYGLGSENQNLPGYIVINGGLIPSGGLDNFGSSFLPASYQGTIFKPQDHPIANIRPQEKDILIQDRKFNLIKKLDSKVLNRYGKTDALETAIKNYELAKEMQTTVPDLVRVSGESKDIQELYGINSNYGPTKTFARQCLIARRMVERGVRFIELTCPRIPGNDRWDAHGGLVKNHRENSKAVDQPIAGLLKDLKQRGLLDETLVVWSGEFGRTPFAQGSNGRDHNPFGFTIWMAGGGVKGGHIHGVTDEYGYRTVEGKVEMYDLHATILHLLGLDHTKLTFFFGGRNMRLTDVHGEVIHELLV